MKKYILHHLLQLNVPLNLPQARTDSTGTSEAQINVYDDVPIPLRIHDCSLNILVLMQSTGIVYICHHYFYKVSSITLKFHIWGISTKKNFRFCKEEIEQTVSFKMEKKSALSCHQLAEQLKK